MVEDRTYHDVLAASVDRIEHAFPLRGASRASSVAGVGHERGRCLPTAHDNDRTSDTPVATPSYPRSHAPSCVLLRNYRSRSFGYACGSLGRESRQDHFPRRLVKGDASDDPERLPSAGTLRRIRWRLPRARWPRARLDTPVPRPPHRFWRCCGRWMTLSRHPGPCVDPAPLHRCDPTRGPSFRTTRLPTFHRRHSPRLGPRSLDADRSFWSALPSVFEARCRLPTSANCYYDVRTRTRALSFLAGTEAKTSFLFLRVHALSLAGAVTRGEPRFVR